MATCLRCQQSHFGMFDLKGGYCAKCRSEMDAENEARRVRSAKLANRDDLAQIVMTTEQGIGIEVSERLGLVSAECAFGINMFKDLLAGVRDTVGGRSATIQNVLRDSRKVVLDELRTEAFELGADAVIAIQFQYVELSTVGNMVLMVANGTAVKLKTGAA